MSVAEIQNEIVKRVLETEDLNLLRRFQELFQISTKTTDWWLTISEKEKELIEIGEKEFEAGLGRPYEEIRKEIDERFKGLGK